MTVLVVVVREHQNTPLSFSTKKVGVPCDTFSETLGSPSLIRRIRASWSPPGLGDRPSPFPAFTCFGAELCDALDQFHRNCRSEKGKRMVPLLRLWPASSRLNAAPASR